MRRILHIITSLKTGGAEHLLVDLLPCLKELNNEVELLVFNGDETAFMQEIKSRGIRVYSLSNKGNVYNPVNVFKLLKYIDSYDIIHTHLSICQLYAPLAKLLKFCRVPLVTTEHSTNNRRRGKFFMRLLDKWMYARYKKVICISLSTRKNLESQIGKKTNLVDINNGVDIKKFYNSIKDLSSKDDYLVTMIARFFEAKDQDTLIRAISILPSNYKLQLVGDGPRKDVIKKLIDELNLNKRVRLLGVRNDIPNILADSDIIVLSSHWEGLSLSSIEGMASGRPFIASDVDGLREIVGGYGCLFPHGDYHCLAEKIKSLCETPSLYQSIAEKCQNRAKDFDIRKMALNYNALYDELCNPLGDKY